MSDIAHETIDPIAVHPAYRIVGQDQNSLKFIGPFETVTIPDPNHKLTQVVGQIAAGTSLSEILEDLEPGYSGPIIRVLNELTERGVLCSISSAGELVQQDGLSASLGLARKQIDHIHTVQETDFAADTQSKVGLVAPSPLERTISANLTSLGLNGMPADCGTPPNDIAHMLVVDQTSNIGNLSEVNRYSLKYQLPTVYCFFDQRQIVVGPIVIPGESACLKCIEHRWNSNSLFPTPTGDTDVIRNHHPSLLTAQMAIAWACSRLKALTLGLNHLCVPGEVTELDLVSNDIKRGTVLRMPGCEACNSTVEKPVRAIRLANFA